MSYALYPPQRTQKSYEIECNLGKAVERVMYSLFGWIPRVRRYHKYCKGISEERILKPNYQNFEDESCTCSIKCNFIIKDDIDPGFCYQKDQYLSEISANGELQKEDMNGIYVTSDNCRNNYPSEVLYTYKCKMHHIDQENYEREKNQYDEDEQSNSTNDSQVFQQEAKIERREGFNHEGELNKRRASNMHCVDSQTINGYISFEERKIEIPEGVI